MLNNRSKEITIVNGLKAYCGCEVIRANQNSPIPAYPYIAYTVITPISAHNKSYSVDEETGDFFNTYKQTWSFTIQSDDADEALSVAFKAYDWFKIAGLTHLNDNGVIVLSCSDMTNRDNLLTIEYEHRNGFDVTFGMLHVVSLSEEERGGIIEQATIKNNDMEVIINGE